MALIVLAHGAGAGMHHQHMQSLANALAEVQLETLRFNFPFMEQSHKPPDKLAVCLATLASAIDLGMKKANGLPLLLAGHSFGGSMASHYIAQTQDTRCAALIYFSFPLHGVGKPSASRAEHLPTIRIPQLFLTGTRDGMADQLLLSQVISSLPTATLIWLESADHGFKRLMGRQSSPGRGAAVSPTIYMTAAEATISWLVTLELTRR